MKRVLTLSCVALFAVSGSLATAQGESAERTYKAAGALASKPTATISYGRTNLQAADLRLPKGRGPFPVAVVLHGKRGQARRHRRVRRRADRQGFATWNVEYRRVGDPGGGWPGTFEDVAAAVDKLAEVAPLYRLDLKRVAFVGHSAGAYFALWAASRPRLDPP
jgi:acetyl esterase/lipase